MRDFIYKIIIAGILFIVIFEFTIGKRIDPITENIGMFSNEQGRKELIGKLRKEKGFPSVKFQEEYSESTLKLESIHPWPGIY